jgi:serine/threonine protein kinase
VGRRAGYDARVGEPAPAAEEFGPYLVLERLGVGGMATVHRAIERGIEGLEREVALKRLLPHLATNASLVKAFVREARLASLLQHANIAQVFMLGRVGSTYFISMEFVDGYDVRRLLRAARTRVGPPPLGVTLALIRQICDALDYAHTRAGVDGAPLGLVHRDVTPANLLITRSGHIKVIDFGIAKAQAAHLRTATGRVKGKVAYMAPEALQGRELDHRSDLYSLGVVFHELLTARPLFAQKNDFETMLEVQRGEVPRPSSIRPELPRSVDDLVMRALAGEPELRWSSAAELREALLEVPLPRGGPSTPAQVGAWLAELFADGIPPAQGGEERSEPRGGWEGEQTASDADAMVILDDVPDFSHARDGEPTTQPDAMPLRDTGGWRRVETIETLAVPPPGRVGEGAPRSVEPIRAVPAPIPRTPGRVTLSPTATTLPGFAAAPTTTTPTPTPAAAPAAAAAAAAAAVAVPAAVPATAAAAIAVPAAAAAAAAAAAPAAVPAAAAAAAAAADADADAAVHDRAVTIDDRASTDADRAATAADTPAPRRRGFLGASLGMTVAAALGGGAVAVGIFVATSSSSDKTPTPTAPPISQPAAPTPSLSATPTPSTTPAPTPAPAPDPTPPAPTTGSLTIEVEPITATITVDDLAPHTGSPYTLDVAPGPHRIAVAADGFQPWSTSVDIKAGTIRTVQTSLVAVAAATTPGAAQATLALDSTPSGLDVILDGKALAFPTPIRMGIAPGKHSLVVRPKGGAPIWSKVFTARANHSHRFHAAAPGTPDRKDDTPDEPTPDDATTTVDAVPAPSEEAATPDAAPAPVEEPVDARPNHPFMPP